MTTGPRLHAYALRRVTTARFGLSHGAEDTGKRMDLGARRGSEEVPNRLDGQWRRGVL